jgi:tripartite-type tricarboxylate transporter receptor subunit TctC
VLPDLRPRGGGFDIDCASLSAFEFPKGTPDAIVRRLAEATNKVVETRFVRERFETLGVASSRRSGARATTISRACRPRSNGRHR